MYVLFNICKTIVVVQVDLHEDSIWINEYVALDEKVESLSYGMVGVMFKAHAVIDLVLHLNLFDKEHVSEI